jgi:glycosyltransferase involved in cell wall biosynthesis
MTFPLPTLRPLALDAARAASPGVAATRRPRVLLVAESANPKLFSVSLIGWSFARALSEVAEVHLASEERNREDILAAGLGGMEFTSINNRRWQGLAWNISRKLRGGTALGWSTYSAFATLAYPMFEREVWRVFGDRLRAGAFDVVHRVTPNSPMIPSLLARRCARIGVPFVLGPLNGGVPWPKEFPELRSAEREWLSPLRGAARFLPGFRATRSHASAILVGARTALEEMPRAHRAKCVLLSENAIDRKRFPRSEPRAPRLPLRVAFVGRLVPLKGVDMLLEAAAPLALAGKLALDIIGDGPERAGLERLAERLGIAHQVEFPGWVEHTQMAARLGRSQVLGFPSVREFGGGVVLEAMALGLVPIVVNHGGPGELVPPGTGFAVPLGPRAAIIASFREVLESLAANPKQITALGRRAQDHVHDHFTWDAKARQILGVYRDVLAGGPTRSPLSHSGSNSPSR